MKYIKTFENSKYDNYIGKYIIFFNDQIPDTKKEIYFCELLEVLGNYFVVLLYDEENNFEPSEKLYHFYDIEVLFASDDFEEAKKSFEEAKKNFEEDYQFYKNVIKYNL